jgi:hypothetical protein
MYKNVLEKFLKDQAMKNAMEQQKQAAMEQSLMQETPMLANVMMKAGGEMIRRADGSYSQRGLWDNIRENAGSGKKPTDEMLRQEAKIKKMFGGAFNPLERFLPGGETGGCPEGYYYNASSQECVKIPERVSGRPSSEFNQESLKSFLERSSERDFNVSSSQERISQSTQNISDLESRIQKEREDAEMKRQSIYRNAVQTVKEQERLQREMPEEYDKALDIYYNNSGKYNNPSDYAKAIKTIHPDILKTMPYDGRSGFIYSNPKWANLACSSGICTVMNESGVNVGDLPSNPKLVNKLKNDPRFEVFTTEDINPETGKPYVPMAGDVVSKTGYAPIDYRNTDLGNTIRPHDAAIVGEEIPGGATDNTRRYSLYGNKGAALNFTDTETTLYNPSAVKRSPTTTGDYGTFIRYVGNTKQLESEMSEEDRIRREYEQKLLDEEGRIVGLPTFSPSSVISNMQSANAEIKRPEEMYAERLQRIQNSEMSNAKKRKALKAAEKDNAMIQKMLDKGVMTQRQYGGNAKPTRLVKIVKMR